MQASGRLQNLAFLLNQNLVEESAPASFCYFSFLGNQEIFPHCKLQQ